MMVRGSTRRTYQNREINSPRFIVPIISPVDGAGPFPWTMRLTGPALGSRLRSRAQKRESLIR
jgi:hypothetical protein